MISDAKKRRKYPWRLLREQFCGRITETKHCLTRLPDREEAEADVLLTTDDKLVRMASRLQLEVKVIDPMTFMARYVYGGDKE